MPNSPAMPTGPKNEFAFRKVPPGQRKFGKALLLCASLAFGLITLAQTAFASGLTSFGFENWWPVLFAFVVWAICLCLSQVLTRGERGQQAIFVLPAVLFTLATVIFPTLFGFYIAFTDWNLSSLTGRHFNGIDNIRTLLGEACPVDSGSPACSVLSGRNLSVAGIVVDGQGAVACRISA